MKFPSSVFAHTNKSYAMGFVSPVIPRLLFLLVSLEAMFCDYGCFWTSYFYYYFMILIALCKVSSIQNFILIVKINYMVHLQNEY